MAAGARRFGFRSWALPEGAFEVLRFEGTEGLSRGYRFAVDLVAAGPDPDPDAVLGAGCTFTLLRPGGDLPVHGVLASFEQLHRARGLGFFRATLVPRLWRLSRTWHNQVFLDRTVPQVLEALLAAAGLAAPADVDLRLQAGFEPREFLCQYAESHLDCFSRWAGHQGIYFYFEQGDGAERLVLTDSRLAHGAMPRGEGVGYRPLDGLDGWRRVEAAMSLRCCLRPLPRAVLLKDHDPMRPALDLAAQAEVHPGGLGEVYHYGQQFGTPEEGRRLARIRAEELLCRERRYVAETSVPFLRPGYRFELRGHPLEDCNQEYLTVAVRHRGSQAALGLAGGSGAPGPEELEPFYRNTVEAIPAAVQFRPGPGAPRPRIPGLLPARVDAEGSGQEAELDRHGRYKIILPFDRSGRPGGKASAWLPRLQPFAGGDHGLHLPLHQGAEVMVGFEDGDPDRPFIAGAVPNPAAPSVVTRANPACAILQSAGQLRLTLDDQPGQERILLEHPGQGASLCIGAAPAAGAPGGSTGDPDPEPGAGGGGLAGELGQLLPGAAGAAAGIFLGLSGPFVHHTHFSHEKCLGLTASTQIGNDLRLVIGWNKQLVLGRSDSYTFPASGECGTLTNRINQLQTRINESVLAGARATEIVADYQTICDGMVRDFGQMGTFLARRVKAMENASSSVDRSQTRVEARVKAAAAERNQTVPEYQSLYVRQVSRSDRELTVTTRRSDRAAAILAQYGSASVASQTRTERVGEASFAGREYQFITGFFSLGGS